MIVDIEGFSFLGFNNKENHYINNRTKLILKCNVCGYIWKTTTYDKFVSRTSQCPKCSKKYKRTEEEIINDIQKRCKELNYSFLGFENNSEKINRSTKLILKCNVCGDEWNTTTVLNFLRHDRNSHKCGRKNQKSNSKIYVNIDVLKNRIEKKIGNTSLFFERFCFSEKEYHGTTGGQKVLLKCTKCGSLIEYSINTILYSKNGLKCKKCEFNGKLDNETATKLIEDKCKLLNYTFLGYNNDKNRYDGKDTKLILKCNVCGYIWKTTNYYTFTTGVIKCVGCLHDWKLEKEVKYILDKNDIKYEQEKKFPWLRYISPLKLDFFLPDYNIFIECQGRQHFLPVKCYGGEEGFELTQKRDIKKYKLCLEHGLKPLYYGKKWKTFNNEIMIDNEQKLLEKIFEKNG